MTFDFKFFQTFIFAFQAILSIFLKFSKFGLDDSNFWTFIFVFLAFLSIFQNFSKFDLDDLDDIWLWPMFAEP